MKRLDLKLVLFLILSISLALTLGCNSNKLDRSKAKIIIAKQLKYPSKVKWEINPNSRISVTVGQYDLLAEYFFKPGLMKVKDVMKGSRGFHLIIEPTISAKQYIVDGDYDNKNRVKLLLAEKHITDVTGIRFISEKEAIVEYTEYYSTPTPFFKLWLVARNSGVFYTSSRPHIPLSCTANRKVRLVLYDDGWRVKNSFW